MSLNKAVWWHRHTHTHTVQSFGCACCLLTYFCGGCLDDVSTISCQIDLNWFGEEIKFVAHCHDNFTGFVQTLKCFFQDFPELANTKFQGFPELKNPLFQDIPGHIPVSNMGLHKVKNCIYKISYQCICNTVRKWKRNTKYSVWPKRWQCIKMNCLSA